MSRGQVVELAEWRNKKTPTNQHNNSDDSFYQNKQMICDGEVTLFTTKNSGGNWQMRMRVEGHRQYHQKSLRTKNYETAKERAKKEHAIATVKLSEGKSLFSPPLYKAIELYIQHRQKEVLTESLAQGTFERIKGQLKWLTRYPTVNAEHRLDTFGAKTLYDYQMFRMKRNASLQTIRNELSVINAFCKWAYDEGLHNTEKFLHPKCPPSAPMGQIGVIA